MPQREPIAAAGRAEVDGAVSHWQCPHPSPPQRTQSVTAVTVVTLAMGGCPTLAEACPTSNGIPSNPLELCRWLSAHIPSDFGRYLVHGSWRSARVYPRCTPPCTLTLLLFTP